MLCEEKKKMSINLVWRNMSKSIFVYISQSTKYMRKKNKIEQQ